MRKLGMLLAAAILIGGGVAVAREHGGHGTYMRHGGPGEGMDRHMEYVADKLDLTDEQRAAAKKLHEGVEDEVRGIFDQQRDIREAIDDMLDSANPDATALGQKMIEGHALRTRLQAIHESLQKQFKGLLNADQLKKFEQLESDHMRGPDMHGMPGDSW